MPTPSPHPLQVHVLGALPLRNMSRVWGYLNSFELPVWIRPYGFRLYAYMFGCNLDEIEPSDLTHYASLGDFFYRKLKAGVRPVDNSVLVSRLPCISVAPHHPATRSVQQMVQFSTSEP